VSILVRLQPRKRRHVKARHGRAGEAWKKPRESRRDGTIAQMLRSSLTYARPFFAEIAAGLPATSHGRFGRSTGALSRFSMRSYW
jgi:hypothetical protein